MRLYDCVRLLVNYLSKFLPNLTDVLHPLQNLTRKDVPWNWSSTQQNAFEKIKEMVTNTPVLAYYNVNEELTVENDASEYGLGSVLLQEGKPVAYASRTLSQCERNYAQIEKEMLAITFGLEKFHTYTYGRQVTVVTDHKPLISIIKKPLSRAPKRLQALTLRAQAYNFDIVYKPGKNIPLADALSRSPVDSSPETEKVHVNNLSYVPVKPEHLEEIRMATQTDETLKTLQQVISQGWPEGK